jgi:excisionase family DNA binding protein
MADDEIPQFLTTAEAGEMLRCGRRTITRLLAVGKLRGRRIESPYQPINRRSRWLVERTSVEEFLGLGRGEPAPRKPRPSLEAKAILKAMGIPSLPPGPRYGPKPRP